MPASPWDSYVVGLVGLFGILAVAELAVVLIRAGMRSAAGESLDG